MKKSILTPALICILTSLIIQKASCQPIINSAKLKIETTETDSREHNSLVPENTTEDYINAINIKAVRKFIRNFKDAKNVTWSKAKDGGYVARFINDSIRTVVAYNSNGSWSYTFRKYTENKMPADVRDIVKSAFFDYAIMEVTEIEAPQERENVMYNVLIKYAGNFKILNICNGDMEVITDYTKP